MKVAGIGFRQGAPLDSLREVLHAVEAQGGQAEALASLPEKAADPRLQTLAAERGLPLIPVAVAGQTTPTKSPRVMALHATGPRIVGGRTGASARPRAGLQATPSLHPSAALQAHPPSSNLLPFCPMAPGPSPL